MRMMGADFEVTEETQQVARGFNMRKLRRRVRLASRNDNQTQLDLTGLVDLSFLIMFALLIVWAALPVERTFHSQPLPPSLSGVSDGPCILVEYDVYGLAWVNGAPAPSQFIARRIWRLNAADDARTVLFEVNQHITAKDLVHHLEELDAISRRYYRYGGKPLDIALIGVPDRRRRAYRRTNCFFRHV